MEPVPVAWVSLMRPPAPVSAPGAVQAIRCKAAAVQAIQHKDHLQCLWQVMQGKCDRLPADGVEN